MIETSQVQSILRPFLINPSEENKYNSKLQEAIDKIKALVPLLNHQEKEEANIAIQRLNHQILTNNHYVNKKREKDPHFSVFQCTVTQDLDGLKFLLRTGADPNEKKNGRVPIHVAASNELHEFVRVLVAHPSIDLQAETLFGKGAADLAQSDTIRALVTPQDT